MSTGAGDTQVLEYHEVTDTDEGVTEIVLHLRGAADGRRATLTATQEGNGPLTVDRFNDRSTTVFDRGAFGLFQAGVKELERRGFAPDVGCLQFSEGDSTEKANDSAQTAEGREDQPDASTTNEKTWCLKCSDGPFSSLSIHNGRSHDGDPLPADHEPTADELVGEDDVSLDDADAGDDEEDEPDDQDEDVDAGEGDINDTLFESWMPADPHEVVDGSPIRRPLEDFLTALEVEESVVAVMRRVAATNSNQVREVARDLGLTENGQLLDDDVLQERIAKLREVA